MESSTFSICVLLLGALILAFAESTNAEIILPYTRVLDPDSGYILEWKVNRTEKTIQFNITTHVTDGVSTLFGLTKKGSLNGGDVVVFGMNGNKSAYIYDMHGTKNNTLVYDSQQNWKILSAEKIYGGEIKVSIERSLDTCDKDNDIVITADLLHVVWGSVKVVEKERGNSSSVESISFKPKSSHPIYLLDKELTPLTPSNSPLLQTWRMSRDLKLAARPTSYWCSIHKGPKLSRKNHIVGFGSYFKNSKSQKHVHHQAVYRCSAPKGQDPDSLFGKFSQQPGQECYLPVDGKYSTLPVPYCREAVFAWGLGGHDTQLPDDVGIPLESNEYFMMETHYSNPKSKADVVVENGVEFQITPRLRKNEGGMFFITYGVITPENTNEYIFAVPQKAKDFIVAGHCGPQCVKEMLPKSGVEVSAVFLHSHHAVKMHVRHFRGGIELPEILGDNDFDPSFTQWRLLSTPVTILPEDHLTIECSYDLSGKNGSLVGGHSSTDEMCNAFLLTNKRVPYLYCGSEYPASNLFSIFGVQNVTWDTQAFERVVASSPFTPNNVGRRFSDVVDSIVSDWTDIERKQLEDELKLSEHIAVCPSLENLAKVATTAPKKVQKLFPLSWVEYPRNAVASKEKSSCKKNKKPSDSEGEKDKFGSLPGENFEKAQYDDDNYNGWLQQHISHDSFDNDHPNDHLSSSPHSFQSNQRGWGWGW